MYGVYKNDNLVGGICGFEKDGFTSGNYPLTPYQGVLIAPMPDAKPVTVGSMHLQVGGELAKSLPYEHISITNHWTYPDIRPFKWAGWAEFVKYTYVIREPSLDNMEKDTRYDIVHNKPEFITWGDFKPFQKMYEAMVERKGIDSPPFDLKIFDWTIFNHTLTTDKASACFILDEKRSYYIMAASEKDGGAMALAWEYIKGCKEIDLVGCNLREIGHYKRGFGGEITPYIGVKK